MQIENNVFVVTGGGNGMGREVALELLRRGARVAAADLSADGLAETARLAAAGDRLTTHVLNVADRDAVLALPAAVEAAHGQVDGLLNIAGIIQPFVKIQDLPFEQIERVMNVNFWGVVGMTKAFLPTLLARPAAAILNVSSMGGFLPVPGQAAYGAAKAAVTAFLSGLRQRLQKSGVNVLTIKPGFVDTPMTKDFPKGALWAQPDAVAAGIVKAIDKRRSVVYLPWFWWGIMSVIRSVPEFVFKRVKL